MGDALDREDALTYSAFGGEATVVVVTSGVAVGIESGFAAVGFQDDFEGFVPESASGSSTDADNPSAPAVLGSVSVGAVAASAGRPTVRSARTGAPVTAADVIESVAVAVEGDMTFGTLDFRTGTARDRCLRTGTGTDGGVLPLALAGSATSATGAPAFASGLLGSRSGRAQSSRRQAKNARFSRLSSSAAFNPFPRCWSVRPLRRFPIQGKSDGNLIQSARKKHK